MSDVAVGNRIEPAIGSTSAGATPAPAAPPPPAAAVPVAQAARPTPVATAERVPSGGEQLARIEDKAARIEEKFARVENLLQKVESAAVNLNDVARQSDMERLSGRVGRMPGFRGLLVTAVVTSLLTAGIIVAIIRYLPGLVAQ